MLFFCFFFQCHFTHCMTSHICLVTNTKGISHACKRHKPASHSTFLIFFFSRAGYAINKWGQTHHEKELLFSFESSTLARNNVQHQNNECVLLLTVLETRILHPSRANSSSPLSFISLLLLMEIPRFREWRKGVGWVCKSGCLEIWLLANRNTEPQKPTVRTLVIPFVICSSDEQIGQG